MSKGGTAVWKTQVWVMLFVCTVCLVFISIRKLSEKRQNYQELWEWKGQADGRIEILERKCK